MSGSASSSQTEDGNIEEYHQEMLRRAELQCELTLRKANIKKLMEDISVLAEELKRECLVEKWGSCPQNDGSQRVKPDVQTAALCAEVAENPELLDEVLMRLHYQKAKLKSEVTEVMSKLKPWDEPVW
ncbi:uncharacterized protein LOC110987142 [Acanthaster planci]|uniref:Uncharacterized protein LOC110987142 n=1 Tax=Acanthaster planci TaxID=133434 RepID=A0A8B7ZIB6_ACAPL|nr:uncharacterized protein LOC110987142 [Acanthaster planci]XP_022105303.1 uncharacterized protein LOC110987142 [Acanthaster planci]XP_022105304.1 uncharacterized protein LOC110987142 [Acanthaster planci]